MGRSVLHSKGVVDVEGWRGPPEFPRDRADCHCGIGKVPWWYWRGGRFEIHDAFIALYTWSISLYEATRRNWLPKCKSLKKNE